MDHFEYEEQAWFPPRSTGHLFDFRALFRKAGIAANYVGCLKWFAWIHSFDHDWFDASIRLQLKGFKKFAMQNMGIKLTAHCRDGSPESKGGQLRSSIGRHI